MCVCVWIGWHSCFTRSFCLLGSFYFFFSLCIQLKFILKTNCSVAQNIMGSHYRKIKGLPRTKWGFFYVLLSYVCYAFVRVYVPCCHLLGKGWPLCSRFWCLTVTLSLSHWYPGSGVVLDCIDSWSLHPYLLQSENLSSLEPHLFLGRLEQAVNQ